MKYDTIQMIRYMGNKNKLLDFIIPAIEEVTEDGDTICDLFSGTSSVSYGLKKRNRIITNDIQRYSYVIAKAIIENNEVSLNREIAKTDLSSYIEKNKSEKNFRFFLDHYSNTYFSKKQCIQIDSIRYAIEQHKSDPYRFHLYLCALMFAMTKSQATPGHFAQYLNRENERVKKLYQYNIEEIFYEKCAEFETLVKSSYNNIVYNRDYKELLNLEEFKDVKCFYIDPPYTIEQYSRFYHLLETVCKYDYPKLTHKGLYRGDRFKSQFSYKKRVNGEFSSLFQILSNYNASVVVSYSNKGLIKIEDLINIIHKYYEDVSLKEINYTHSTQGKGSNKLKEYLIIGKNKKNFS